ncbi:MAG: septum formation family protein [Actinomadura sp.]
MPFPTAPPRLPGGPSGKTNGFAIAAMVLGILGGVLLSVVLGIIALVQIRRNGDAGRGMAVLGLVASATWLVGGIAVGVAIGLSELREEIVNSGQPRSPSDSSPRLFPRPGECFNVPPGDTTSANVTIVPCAPPHDAQTIVAFPLTGGSWPGDAEVERQAFAGCEQRITATFKTRTPLPDAQPYVLVPSRLGWLAGDHSVTCALAAADGAELTGPIVIRDPGTREWSELAAGDCFNDQDGSGEATIVELASCTATHSGQVTHTFMLPDGGWLGESAMEGKADRGCTARQDAHFDEHPSSVPLEGWHVYPSEETWAQGDREVVCYITGEDKRPLKRSIMAR